MKNKYLFTDEEIKILEKWLGKKIENVKMSDICTPQELNININFDTNDFWDEYIGP